MEDILFQYILIWNPTRYLMRKLCFNTQNDKISQIWHFAELS